MDGLQGMLADAEDRALGHLFFALPPMQETPPITAPAGYTFQLWRPGLLRVRPRGGGAMPYAAWWAAHHLHVFANRDYSVFVAWAPDGRLVHRSIVFPRWARYPFMGAADLQIGDIWTDPEHRGRGLTPHALHTIVGALRQGGRTFWYVVAEDNPPSIRAVQKAGFLPAGSGVRSSRMGLRLLGSFVITQPAPVAAASR